MAGSIAGFTIAVHHGSKKDLGAGRGIADGVGACVDGAQDAFPSGAAGGDDGHGGVTGTDGTDHLGGAFGSGDV